MTPENSIAVFIDFENVAIGLRDRKQSAFNVQIVLEKLLDRGRILVKNAYCDWQNYQDARRPLHEAGFVLVEIPHARFSGKNSADIRMVVDALDLCYTRSHIDMFALVTGDSDFTPLVSKLRENGKTVVGIGVRDSSSALLIESCDDFWYYDDLVSESEPEAEPASDTKSKGKQTSKKVDSVGPIIRRIAGTAQSLLEHRGESVHGSVVKQAFKRKRPNFSERSLGFGSFSELLEDARDRGILSIEKDEASGGYRITGVKSRRRR